MARGFVDVLKNTIAFLGVLTIAVALYGGSILTLYYCLSLPNGKSKLGLVVIVYWGLYAPIAAYLMYRIMCWSKAVR